jgi:hypothetical protein
LTELLFDKVRPVPELRTVSGENAGPTEIFAAASGVHALDSASSVYLKPVPASVTTKWTAGASRDAEPAAVHPWVVAFGVQLALVKHGGYWLPEMSYATVVLLDGVLVLPDVQYSRTNE